MSNAGTEIHPEPSQGVDEEWMNNGVRQVSTQYGILFGTWEINPKQSQSQ